MLGATEAYQLLKVPFLFQHYKTHQRFDTQLSFSSFINMHYVQSQTYDNDYQEDMQLPFKTSNRTVSLLNFVSFFVPKQVSIHTFFVRSSISYPLMDDQKHVSSNLGDIFQPPRFS